MKLVNLTVGGVSIWYRQPLYRWQSALCSLRNSNHVMTCIWFFLSDVIMGAMASQITSVTIVYSIDYSDADQRKHHPRHWPLCGELTGEFPAQRASNAENVSIWWCHHVTNIDCLLKTCDDVVRSPHAIKAQHPLYWISFLWQITKHTAVCCILTIV